MAGGKSGEIAATIADQRTMRTQDAEDPDAVVRERAAEVEHALRSGNGRNPGKLLDA